jgi:hypothetical protein
MIPTRNGFSGEEENDLERPIYAKQREQKIFFSPQQFAHE